MNSDGASPEPDQKSITSAWTLLAWAVIALAATFIIFFRAPSGPATAAPDPVDFPDVPLQLVCRQSLGLDLVGQSLGGQFRSALSNPAIVVGTLRDNAGDDDLARLRIVPVIAEIAGAEQAIAQLDELNAAARAQRPDEGAAPEASSMDELAGDQPDPVEQADDAGAEGDWSEDLAEDAAILRRLYVYGHDDLTQAELDRLKTRHHWFGELAATWGMETPERTALLNRAKRGSIAMLTLVTVAIAAGGAGLVLLILIVIGLFTRRLRPAYPAARVAMARPHSAYLEAMAVFLVLFIGAGLLGTYLADQGVSHRLVGLLIWVLTPIPVLWPLLRGRPLAEVHLALGLHRGKGVLREVGWGVIGYMAGLPIVALGLGVSFLILNLTGAKPSHPAVDNLAGLQSLIDLALLYLLASVWAPVTEELIFRGAMYTHMRQRCSAIVSALVVAFLFAAIHPQGYALVPALMSLAIVFALMREFRGSIIPCMVAHAIQNTALITVNALMLMS
ncbi:MAG: CPBP family intramembrane metalloprotease [Phycisphaerales bacterium]|nr:CPBP family intramembrane metalloprotease [Phycisphaerales bacterium]